MAEIKEDIYFYGGMNSDDEDRFLPKGDYRRAEYLRGASFLEGNMGVLQNLPGTLYIENPDLPAIDNFVIGACNWVEANAIIYFVYNDDPNDHGIYKYDITTNTITAIVKDATLNFQKEQKIYDAFVLDGLLYWTDGYFEDYELDDPVTEQFNYNPPRMANIVNLENNVYANIDFQLFDAVKWPPRYAPTVEYNTNVSPAAAGTSLYGSLFQFVYKYIYENNEESCWSPISEMPLPDNGYWMTGNKTNVTEDNEIEVTYNTGHETVKKIVHAVRVGNDNPFHVWQTIDKLESGLSDNTDYTIYFNNQSFGIDLPLNIPNFHFVPQVARCQELLTGRGGEIAYGNIREGYAPVNTSVSISYVLEPVPSQQIAAWPTIDWTNGVGTQVTMSFASGGGIFPYNEGDLLIFQLQLTSVSLEPDTTLVFTVTNETTIDDIVTNVAAFLTAELAVLDPTSVVTFNLTTDTVNIVGVTYAYNPVDPPDGGQVYVIRPVLPQRTWKSGTTHKIAIQYEDRANRSGSVMYVPAGELQIPSYSQANLSGFTNPRAPYIIKPQITITNTPPIWATHYRILTQYSTNIESFGWYGVGAVTSIDNNPLRLNLYLDYYYRDTYGAGPVHQIQPGDKVRFVRKTIDFDPAFNCQAPYIDSGEDFVMTVTNYTPGGVGGADIIEVEYFDFTLYQGDSLPNNARTLRGALIEIFRERQTGENEPWFETPVAFPILNEHTSNRVHGGSAISGFVVDMDVITQEVIVTGNLTGLAGYFIGFTGTTGNDGLYTVDTVVSYDDILNETTITLTTPFGFNSTTGSYSMSLQQTNAVGAIAFIGPEQGCGDIYLRPRQHRTYRLSLSPVSAMYFFCTWEEDPAYSDFFPSSWYSRGRIGIEDENAEEKVLKSVIVHSKNYLQNTNVNGLNVFEVQDRETLNITYGDLTRLVQVGDTLQCIQERKNTSIYIQRVLALDPSGNVSYSSSDKTFGGKRPREEDWGTSYGESVIKVENAVYYWDNFNGQFVVSMNNGQRSLSEGEFKFKADSTKLAIQFNAPLDEKYILGFHDSQNDEVGWLFASKYEWTTVVFNYTKGRWSHYRNHNPDWIWSNGNTYCEFGAGYFYLGNQELDGVDPNYNTFFDVLVDSKVKFISNEAPMLNKRWLTVSVKSNGSDDPWSMLVDIPANLSYTAMQSRILSGNFKIREGYYMATYKKDLNSPNFATTDLALINGRDLRGYAAIHTATLSQENKKTTLFGTHINTVASEVKQ